MRTYLLLLFCATLYGSNFVLGSLLLQEFPAMHLSAYRLAVSSVFLMGYLILSKRMIRLTARDVIYLIPIALIGMLLHQVSFFTGLQTIDATTTSLILSLSPIFTALLARIFLRESFPLRMAVGSLVALIGVFFVVSQGKGLHLSLTTGMGIMFICMLAFSGSTILMRKLTEKMDALRATSYSTLLGCVLVFPVAVWQEADEQSSHSLGWWILLISSALLIQGLCAIIWNNQIRKVGAAKATVFLNLQPFVAMVLGYLMLGNPVTFTQIGGSILIVGGVVLSTLQKIPRYNSHNKALSPTIEKE
ncbi:DMT family transporter [Paenibacillus sp. JNUCC31]|uniref:DMT family transporter n=1 Tax=Paenibacillus sp. JNUCC-31 TaxID=2777983 RepID=UPI00177A8A50|nr:DMT family transporter [Paenibacillus sp. JNUCC-31]QOS79543.1 DMT family transporter [Paenibacillus sp. JNUCC-31]